MIKGGENVNERRLKVLKNCPNTRGHVVKGLRKYMESRKPRLKSSSQRNVMSVISLQATTILSIATCFLSTTEECCIVNCVDLRVRMNLQ